MRVEIFNYSGRRTVSRRFLKVWVLKAVRELKKRKIKLKELNKALTIAFVDEGEIKKLNQAFRGYSKVTDVLSFPSNQKEKNKSFTSIKKWADSKEEKAVLGELALCPSYIQKKAKKANVSVRALTSYMVLHGLLHLLGFEHEKSQRKAQRMFKLQDEVFEKLYPALKNY